MDVKKLKEKYTPNFTEKELIPQIFKGILRLHENKIYHCDLKPQNVFFLDTEQKEIVIGDYGSAKHLNLMQRKNHVKQQQLKELTSISHPNKPEDLFPTKTITILSE